MIISTNLRRKGSSGVAVIKESSTDPLFKAKLACFASIAKAMKGFLAKFQSPAPMAPFFYDDITGLLSNFMQRVVYLGLAFISGLIVHILLNVCTLFHVLYRCTAITVCMRLLAHAEIFVMVWICRQFIRGKD